MVEPSHLLTALQGAANREEKLSLIELALAEAWWEGAEAQREADAKVADSHIGTAEKKRKDGFKPGWLHPDAIEEMQIEERGENIAAVLIAKAIRSAPLATPDPAPAADVRAAADFDSSDGKLNSYIHENELWLRVDAVHDVGVCWMSIDEARQFHRWLGRQLLARAEKPE